MWKQMTLIKKLKLKTALELAGQVKGKAAQHRCYKPELKHHYS